ncbi:hypothetical protein [Actinophytocola sp. KF-1]
MDRLANLIDPVPVPAFTSAICEWLQDAHDAAADLQRVRLSGPRGNWNNPMSFGTDRYQFLVRTAASLTAAIPELQVDTAFQTVALKLPKVGIYQMQVHGGPHGSLADASDLRRELLNSRDHQALFSRPDALFGDRERLTLLWTGTEKDGLTGAWIGQGELVDNHIDWSWKHPLHDVTGAAGIPRQTGPLDPAIFELLEPTLDLRPRDPEEGAQSG